jgi:hypothetical protein
MYYIIPLNDMANLKKLFFILANVFLRVGMPFSCAGIFPEKGGWDTGVGRSGSLKPNIRIPIEKPLLGKPARKIAKLDINYTQFGNFF